MSGPDDFFYFTASERRSVLLLIIAIGCIWCTKQFLSSTQQPNTEEDAQFDEQIKSYLAGKKVDTVVKVLPFDINLVTKKELIKTGLASNIADAWLNFREAVGEFRSADQIGQIYIMDHEWYTENKEKLLVSVKPDSQTRPQKKRKKWKREPFDPNAIDAADLKDWGFSDFAVNNLRKFRDKGGRFHEVEDLSLIYGISTEFFQSIEDLIVIHAKKYEGSDTVFTVAATPVDEPTVNYSRPDSASKTNVNSNPNIDVNAANVYEWQLLKGIGPGYAKRIVAYRDKLGGFSSISQISETFGVPDSVFQKIEPHLIWSDIPSKISINHTTASELAKHPYISRKKASIVINYRDNNHSLESVEDLYKIRIFDSTEIQKLAPYLIF